MLGILAVFLAFALAFLYVEWGMVDGELERGQQMSGAGYVAMTFGIVVTLALGVGLAAVSVAGEILLPRTPSWAGMAVLWWLVLSVPFLGAGEPSA